MSDEKRDLRDELPPTELQVVTALIAFESTPTRLGELGNSDYVREHAPRLREWLVEAGGWVRLGQAGRDDVKCSRLLLGTWGGMELVKAIEVAKELVSDAQKRQEAAAEYLGLTLWSHFVDELTKRYLTVIAQPMQREHPRWAEFVERLDGPDGCDFGENEDGETTWKCEHNHDKASAILWTMGFPHETIDASVAYFQQNAGQCDCEILLNIASKG